MKKDSFSGPLWCFFILIAVLNCVIDLITPDFGEGGEYTFSVTALASSEESVVTEG